MDAHLYSCAVSLLVICITQFSGIIIAADLDNGNKNTEQVISVVVVILNILVLLLLPMQLMMRVPALFKICKRVKQGSQGRLEAASSTFSQLRQACVLAYHAPREKLSSAAGQTEAPKQQSPPRPSSEARGVECSNSKAAVPFHMPPPPSSPSTRPNLRQSSPNVVPGAEAFNWDIPIGGVLQGALDKDGVSIAFV